MDTKTLRGFGIAVALLIGLIATSPALATSTGVQGLGAAVGAIDVWTFSCPAGVGVRARANVFDVAPVNNPAFMQVVLGKLAFLSSQTTDVASAAGFVNGEGGGPSATAQVIGGSGLYAAAFKKTAVGGEGYVGNVICCNAAGACVNPAIFRQINQ